MKNQDFERQVTEYSRQSVSRVMDAEACRPNLHRVDRVVHEESVECASIHLKVLSLTDKPQRSVDF
jgi:hypothetical protein